MLSNNAATRLPPIDDFVTRLIRRKARQLVGRAGFSRSDADDIEQELVLKLLKQRQSFNATQSHWYAFVTTVIERHVATIIRDKRAEKRDSSSMTSLQSIVHDPINGPSHLAATIGQREIDNRLGLKRRSDADCQELAQDTAKVLASLPPAWRDICERLKRSSISTVARELGMPRTTLCYRLRRLREHLRLADLGDYLKSDSSVGAATE